MRRFGHYEQTVYDLKAPKPVATRLEARPNYTLRNEELERLEFAASYGSQICIGLCIGFVFVAATFWG